jgi:hypothetical protein
MGKLYRKDPLTATTGNLAWSIWEGDDFDLKRLTLTFASAPAAISNVQLWLDSAEGSTYDCILREIDPNDCKHVVIEDVKGIANGDKLLLKYTNTGAISVVGTAVVEL